MGIVDSTSRGAAYQQAVAVGRAVEALGLRTNARSPRLVEVPAGLYPIESSPRDPQARDDERLDTQ
jgi:hypothetical protein